MFVRLSPIAVRAMIAWYRFLDDFAGVPDRYREADGFDDLDLCRECHAYPAQYDNKCWGCNAGRRMPS
jgi:hypothetical protein